MKEIRVALPEAFLERMQRLLGDEYDAFLASYGAPPVQGLRANTLKLSPEYFRSLAPFSLTPVPWTPAGFIVGGDEQPGKHPYHAAGLYYLQDPSAMAVAGALDPQPGERILDLAGAPGGKATHIAALMQNQGLLVANEIHGRRVWDLAENLERWGVRNAAITNETPERLAGRFDGFFDRVLVDAPCSGEGMFRRGETARQEWAPELVEGCAVRQTGILEHAAAMVRPGGRLVYSTCTFAPAENEGTIARFLRDHAEFELVEPRRYTGFDRGRPDWLPPEAATPAPARSAATIGFANRSGTPALERTVRLWPHHAAGEGHFIAVLQQTGEPAPGRGRQRPPGKLPAQVAHLYRTWREDNLHGQPGEGRLVLSGTYLYLAQEDLPDLTGSRFIHPGWWLGTIKKDRFEPAHPLAMALTAADVRLVADLPADGEAVRAYLRGESLKSEGEDGWVMVTVDGFPLGWGKRVKGTLKSHYPRGLRWVN